MAEMGISEAFNIVYIILGAIAGLALFAIFVLSGIDVYSLSSKEIVQRSQIASKALRGEFLLMSNVYDVDLLQYYSNNASKEPYNVYQIQAIVANIFRLVGVMMVIFGIEIAIFLSMMVYSTIKGTPLDQHLEFPFQSMFGIIVVLSVAIVINRNYNFTFTKIIQPDIIKYRRKVREINTYIYDNLPLEEEFYKNIRNPLELKNYMQGLVNTKNYACLYKAMFGWSLYSSLRENSNGNMEPVNDLFTFDNVTTRKLGFEQVMRYEASNFVRNVSADQGVVNGTMRLDFPNTEDENKYRIGVDEYVRGLNTKLYVLKKVNTVKKSMMNYELLIMVTAIAGLIALGFVYFDKILMVYKMIQNATIRNAGLKDDGAAAPGAPGTAAGLLGSLTALGTSALDKIGKK